MGQQKIHDLSIVPEESSTDLKKATSAQDIKKDEKVSKKPKKVKKADTGEKKKAKKTGLKIRKGQKGKVQIKHIMRGKNYNKVTALIDKTTTYSIDEALELAKKTTISEKQQNIEIHLKLNIISPKDNQIRFNATYPHPTGKKQKIAVLTNNPAQVKKLGADVAGNEDLIEKIKKGKLEFDIFLTTPDFMPKIAPLAKILGPKGLMPNPKNETLSSDLPKTLEELSKGRQEVKSDDSGNIHAVIGKTKDDLQKIKDNILYLVQQIKQNKIKQVKGALFRNITLCTTMGPGIKINIESLPQAI